MTEKKQKNEIEKKESTNNEGVPTFVTPLQPIVKQVGEHVMTALGDEETVAVLTTITGSAAGQQVISIPLSSALLEQVHLLIQEIHISDEPEHVPCVGFHCFLENNDTEGCDND